MPTPAENASKSTDQRPTTAKLKLYAEGREGSPRRATWLELFFNLVFVLSMAKLAHLLHAHPDWGGLVSFAVLFMPVLWLWIDFSYLRRSVRCRVI